MISEQPDDLLAFAVELARGAAALVREATPQAGGGERPATVGEKSSDTDLVTAVDRASERWLVRRIAEERPDDAVLGEEGGERSGGSDVRWVLDPIDGTVNFVLGLPAYAVSVAAEVRGEAVAGAICNPVSGELFSAAAGRGAYLDGRRLAGPRAIPLDRAVVGTGFSYDRARRSRQAEVVAELMPRIGDVRRVGSAALDMCNVACGRLDGYFEVGLQPWDFAAGALVAREAGCRVSGLRDRVPSPGMVAVAGARLATDLFAALEELGADAVA